jgi:hypothetical protein
MKSPQSLIDFTQQSWFAPAKQMQRLQADVSAACETLGLAQAQQCELYLEGQLLTIKSNAALSTRLRQVEPELLSCLVSQGWAITAIKLQVVKHASALSQHLKQVQWISPNELRYGKRLAPTPSQRALILAHVKRSKPIKSSRPT